MRRVGRRIGFKFGALLGLASASLAVFAIFELSFALFCLAMFLSGDYQASAQYYRFAAADTASAAFRPKAISWVLAGGLIAAVAGSQLVIYTRNAFAPVMYAGQLRGVSLHRHCCVGDPCICGYSQYVGRERGWDPATAPARNPRPGETPDRQFYRNGELRLDGIHHDRNASRHGRVQLFG